MKTKYETPRLEYELLMKEDVMTASNESPEQTQQDKDNTYVGSYSVFNGLMG